MTGSKLRSRGTSTRSLSDSSKTRPSQLQSRLLHRQLVILNMACYLEASVRSAVPANYKVVTRIACEELVLTCSLSSKNALSAGYFKLC